MKYEDLKRIDAAISERSGWDFSSMKVECAPVPWDYVELIPQFVTQTDCVLDLGTGGGEKFLKIAKHIGSGVGVDSDPEMIETARRNTADDLKEKVKFEVMDANHLTFGDNTFDVVVDRQGPVPVDEISRVLKPGGYFITQTIGGLNMLNINKEFKPDYVPESVYDIDIRQLAKLFELKGFEVIAVCSYNVDYFVKDVESLIFWIKAISSPDHATSAIPGDFSIDKYWQVIDRLWSKHMTPKGFKTNEHRELLIVRKNG